MTHPHTAPATAPTAIIFDLDGTLIHSAPDLHAAANVALAAVGRGALDLPTVTGFIGNGVETLMDRCLRATGGSDPALRARALTFFHQTYDQNMTTLTRPYAGVMDALDRLQDAHIPLGICTNKPMKPAQDICDALDLSRYFKVIQGAQDGLPKKPDPASLLACITALGQKPATVLYVGDSLVDLETARNAGVAFRLFTQGYLNGPAPDLPTDQCFDTWAQHGLGARP